MKKKRNNNKQQRLEICRAAAAVGGLLKQQVRKDRVADAEWGDLFKSDYRDRVFIEQCGCCLGCGLSTWNGLSITLELDHISGDRQDESRGNLRLLCPNCHSQTDTFRSKNYSKVRRSDDELAAALLASSSVYLALKSLNMNLAGGNYVRVRNLIKSKSLVLGYLAI